MTARAGGYDAIVVGGGAAGLVASLLLSRERGARVALFEHSGVLGGKVRVETVKGFHLDYGAHALLLGERSTLLEVLRQAGVDPGAVEASLWLEDEGSLNCLYPGTLRPGPGDILGAARGLAAGAAHLRGALAHGLYAMERPGEIDPADLGVFFLEALKKGHLVGYPRGGWRALLEGLTGKNRARVFLRRGVQRIAVEDGRVRGVVSGGRRVPARCVVAAAPPRRVAAMLDDPGLRRRLSAIRPTYGVSVEIGLKKEAPGPRGIVFTRRPPGFCWAIPGEAGVCPGGHSLLYAFSPLDSISREGIQGRGEALLSALSRLYPGWEKREVFRRVRGLGVTNARLSRDYPRGRRIGVESPIRGLYFAGDWVHGRGFGAELAAWTAREAARRALGELHRKTGVAK